MNVAKVLMMLVVLWALFTPMTSYAATSSPSTSSPATVNEDNSTGNSTGIDNATEPIYSIDARLENATIAGGDNLTLYVFLSGWGVPDYNKVYINWTAPGVVNTDNTGSVLLLWKYSGNLTNTATSDFLDSMYFTLPQEAFSQFAPPTSVNGIGLTETERDYDNGTAPIVVNINTKSGAKSGDYHIAVTFTYGNETDLKQAYTEVQFHVSSNWEQEQQPLEVAGAIIAFLALLVTGIVSICQMRRWRKEGKEGKRQGQVKGSS